MNTLQYYDYEASYNHYIQLLLDVEFSNVNAEAKMTKPVLLLSIIDGMDDGVFNKNYFQLDDWLIQHYEMLMQQFTSSTIVDNISSINIPYWHLESDGFWHLYYCGEQEPKSFLPSIAWPKERECYASLDDDLWILLHNKDMRKKMCEAIIDKIWTVEEPIEKKKSDQKVTTANSLSAEEQAKSFSVGDVLFAKCSKKLLNIRQAKIFGVVNVAKPVLLHAVINGVEEGIFQYNRVPLNRWLEERYASLMKMYTRYSILKDITSINHPFWHLQNDGFWHLKYYYNTKKALSPSTSWLKRHVRYAYFDDDLWGLLQNKEIRIRLLELIIKNKLSGEGTSSQMLPPKVEIKSVAEEDEDTTAVIPERDFATESRKGQPWTLDEEEQIQKYYHQGKNTRTIAAIIGRTEVAIKARLAKLGLIDYSYGQEEKSLVENNTRTQVEKEDDELRIINYSRKCSIVNKYGKTVFSDDGKIKKINGKYYRLLLKFTSFTVNPLLFNGVTWVKEGVIISAHPESKLYRVLYNSREYYKMIEDVDDNIIPTRSQLKVEGVWYNYQGSLCNDVSPLGLKTEHKPKPYIDSVENVNDSLYENRKQAIIQALRLFSAPARVKEVARTISRTAWGAAIKEDDVEVILITMPEVAYVNGLYLLRKGY